MDRTTVIGILAGIGVLVVSMGYGGSLPLFWNPPSLGIVLGGTAAALFVQYSFSQVMGVIRATRDAYFSRSEDPHALIERFARWAPSAYAQQFLDLENEIPAVKDPFLRKGLQGVVDGTPRDLLQEMLASEIESLAYQYRLGQSFFRSMSILAPGFGMLGTLIGLIQMLQNLTDTARLGPALAVALITTFYGAIIANLVASPAAGKLRLRGEEEIKIKMMMLDGILGLVDSLSPAMMKEKLRTHLSPYMQDRRGNQQTGGSQPAFTGDLQAAGPTGAR